MVGRAVKIQKKLSPGESTGNLTFPKTYALACIGPGGSASDSVTVNVVPTVTLTASRSSILKGQSSILEWSSTNADYGCSALWTTSTDASGSEDVSPIETTIYTITCTGLGGSESASVSVTIVIPKGIVPCGRDFDMNGKIDKYEECQFCHFFLLARSILNFGLKTMVPLGVLLIIIGGILILVSSGYAKLLTIGKKLIYTAVIGIVIALGAWVIINTIMVLIADPSVFPWWPWNQIKCP